MYLYFFTRLTLLTTPNWIISSQINFLMHASMLSIRDMPRQTPIPVFATPIDTSETKDKQGARKPIETGKKEVNGANQCCCPTRILRG